MACGGYFSAVVTECGQALSWGNGDWGKLGHGDEAEQHAPRRIVGGDLVWCAGGGSSADGGSSGYGGPAGVALAAAASAVTAAAGCGGGGGGGIGGVSSGGYGAISRVVAAAAGANHLILVTERGEALACGQGDGGRLGLGERFSQVGEFCVSPTRVRFAALCGGAAAAVRKRCAGGGAVPKVAAAAAGLEHTALLLEGGELLTCGYGEHGRLGHGGSGVGGGGNGSGAGADADANLPTRVVVGVASDETSDETPSSENMASPPQQRTSFVAVACGEHHTAAVSGCGRLFTFGRGGCGVLGHGSGGGADTVAGEGEGEGGALCDSSVALPVRALEGVAFIVSVSASLTQTVAMADDGRLFAFGSKRPHAAAAAGAAVVGAGAGQGGEHQQQQQQQQQQQAPRVEALPVELLLDASLPPPPLSDEAAEEMHGGEEQGERQAPSLTVELIS